MNLLPGIKNTTLIDDTYNASPASVAAALEVLKEIPKDEKSHFYAVLGDMLELGKDAAQMHREIGWKTADSGVDVVVALGPLAKNIAEGAVEGGLAREMVFHFASASDAGIFLQERIKSGDVILIKGSQGMRMERVVKELMAEPERAGELLVRQGPEWIK
jgi:UDP-N-acetylmuramoyl-tripeptide--D-alanyl-D-alanine ligase